MADKKIDLNKRGPIYVNGAVAEWVSGYESISAGQLVCMLGDAMQQRDILDKAIENMRKIATEEKIL